MHTDRRELIGCDAEVVALRAQVRTRGMKQYHQGESAPLCPVLI